jgi:hypothetical protein
MKGEEDQKRFSVVLYWLAKRMSAPGGLPKKIDTDVQADYFEALEDIRIERLEWAAKYLFKTTIWFPAPPDIRAAAILAPSSVLPALPLKQPQICEFSEQEIEAAKSEIENILSGGWDLKEAVKIKGCRPVYQI